MSVNANGGRETRSTTEGDMSHRRSGPAQAAPVATGAQLVGVDAEHRGELTADGIGRRVQVAKDLGGDAVADVAEGEQDVLGVHAAVAERTGVRAGELERALEPWRDAGRVALPRRADADDRFDPSSNG